jgi:hypothetical protein
MIFIGVSSMLKSTILAAAGIAAISFSAPASAQTAQVEHDAMKPVTTMDETIRVTAIMLAMHAPARPSPMLSNEELSDQRGGEQLIVANQTLTAVTQGNVLNGDFLAGDVNLSDSALSSFNGVGNILINTGAQVSLQTGMNLTINIGE